MSPDGQLRRPKISREQLDRDRVRDAYTEDVHSIRQRQLEQLRFLLGRESGLPSGFGCECLFRRNTDFRLRVLPRDL